MNDFNKCKICHDYHWTNKQCEPIFNVNIPEIYDDEWIEIRASNHQEAATKACAKSDCRGDFDIVHNGGTDLVLVKDSAGEIKKFKIEARAIPDYSANEIK
jgi:hypothetical protein